MTQTAGSNETHAGGKSNTIAVRFLIAAVAVMGILIVAGLAVVVGRIIYLASAVPRQAPVTSGTVGATADSATPIELELPAGAVVRNLALSSGRMAVHYQAGSDGGIVLIDTVTGAVVSRVRIVDERRTPKTQ